MALIKWSERTAEQVFGQGRLVIWLKSIFATKNHTHTLSEISDLTSSSETAFQFYSNATDYDSNDPVKITKWGRVITVSGIGKLTTSVSANSNVMIGTMPSSYLPSYNIYTPWTGENTQGFIKIRATGSISLHNRSGGATSLSSGDYFVFNCSYII